MSLLTLGSLNDWDPVAKSPKCFDMSCPEASLPLDCTPKGYLPFLLRKAILAGHQCLFSLSKMHSGSLHAAVQCAASANLKGTPPPPPLMIQEYSSEVP